MRIKLYENFVNDLSDNSISLIKKFKNNVEDIFVELLDDGYKVDVKINLLDTYEDMFKSEILIYKTSGSGREDFKFIDVKEYITMFESYIKEYDYTKLSYSFPGIVGELDSAVVGYVKISFYIKL